MSAPEPALRLYRCAAGGPDWAPLPCACASCGAVEAYLRLAGVPFVTEACVSPDSSPTGALPALAFDDECIAASHVAADGDEAAAAGLAVAHAAAAGIDLDAALSPQQRADAAAFRALIQERLVPAELYYAWLVPENFAAFTRPAYGAGLPTGVARWQTWRWQRGVAARLAPRGGAAAGDDAGAPAARERLTADAAAALAALAARLEASSGAAGGSGSATRGGGPFFFGAAPSSLDAFALAHLAFIAHAPTADGPLRAALQQHPSLVAYVERGVSTGAVAAGAAAGSGGSGAAAAGASAAPRATPAARRRAAAAAAAAAAASAAGSSASGAAAAATALRKRTAKEQRFRRRTQLSIAFAITSVIAYVFLADIVEWDFGLGDEDDDADDGVDD